MISEVQDVMEEESLLVDELKIIAGERNGLTSKDREFIRKGAVLLDETMTVYGRVYFRLVETQAQLSAAQDRLREANALLAKSNVFVPLTASMNGVWIGFNG
jgi:hypothetical protein